MKEAVKDLTVGKPGKLIIQFAIPVFLSALFQQMYNTVDTLVVGRYLGTESLAAISCAGNLVYLLINFFAGFSIGAGIIISKYFGAKEYDTVTKSIHTNLTISLLMGILLSAVGYFFCPVFLCWMNVDYDVIGLAVSYYEIYFGGIITLIVYNFCTATMRALGDSQRPLYYLIFSSVLNIILDVLFVGYFRWGVWSAAFATVISQFFSAFLCLVYLARKGHVYSLSFSKFNLDGKLLRHMFHFGFPAAVQNSVIGFANVIVQSQINIFGTVATAGFGIHNKIEGFGFLPIDSFSMAISTYVGQNLGAKEYERARRGAGFGIIAGISIAELIGIVSFIFAPQLVSVFDTNPDVIRVGTDAQKVMSFFYCLLACSHCCAAVLRGSGKTRIPMFVFLGDWCLLRVLYIFTVVKLFGKLDYIYWAYPLTWAISTIIFLICYHKSDWIHGFEEKLLEHT